MERKRVEVVMLPTEGVSQIILDTYHSKEGKLEFLTSSGKAILGNKNQYLYFTSDEEIKEGDWMWRKDEDPVLVTPHFHWDFGVHYRKIIARSPLVAAPVPYQMLQ